MTLHVIASIASRGDDAHQLPARPQAPETEALMRMYGVDPRTEACLLKAEEALAAARAFNARRAALRDRARPRRRARVWLGSVLLAAGHRLLRSVPASAGSAPVESLSARSTGPLGRTQ